MGLFDACCSAPKRRVPKNSTSVTAPPPVDLPQAVWSAAEQVGDEALSTPVAELRPGVRFYGEDGRHFVKDTDGNLVVTQPGEASAAVVEGFDDWLEQQRKLAPRLDIEGVHRWSPA